MSIPVSSSSSSSSPSLRNPSLPSSNEEDDHSASLPNVIYPITKHFEPIPAKGSLMGLITTLQWEEAHELLRQGGSASLTERDLGGYLPLHRALLEGPSSTSFGLDFLQELVSAYPPALHTRGGPIGEVPLHVAVSRRKRDRSLEGIRILLEAYPQAAVLKDGRGLTPLGRACCSAAPAAAENLSAAVVHEILRVRPEAACIRDSLGRSPLDLACRYANPDVIRLVLQACPAAAAGAAAVASMQHETTRDKDASKLASATEAESTASSSPSRGSKSTVDATADPTLPLHVVLSRLSRFNALEEVIPDLVQAYPSALRITSAPRERLPLHMACQCKSRDTVALFLREYPGALYIRDSQHLLPLQVAWAFASSLGSASASAPRLHEICRLLAQAHPEALYDSLAAVFTGGRLWKSRLIDDLDGISSFWGSLDQFVQTVFGSSLPPPSSLPLQYPLHKACRHGAPVDLLERMVVLWGTEGLQQHDNHGWLPIHHAAAAAVTATTTTIGDRRRSSALFCWYGLDTIQLLIRNGGAALHARGSGKERLLPLEYALLSSSSLLSQDSVESSSFSFAKIPGNPHEEEQEDHRKKEQGDQDRSCLQLTVLYLLLREGPDCLLNWQWRESTTTATAPTKQEPTPSAVGCMSSE